MGHAHADPTARRWPGQGRVRSGDQLARRSRSIQSAARRQYVASRSMPCDAVEASQRAISASARSSETPSAQRLALRPSRSMSSIDARDVALVGHRTTLARARSGTAVARSLGRQGIARARPRRILAWHDAAARSRSCDSGSGAARASGCARRRRPRTLGRRSIRRRGSCRWGPRDARAALQRRQSHRRERRRRQPRAIAVRHAPARTGRRASASAARSPRATR